MENPLGDDPADLPALAYQVWMKKECESFAAGVDAISMGPDGGWWEGLTQRGTTEEEVAAQPKTVSAQ